jgi:hypothetical protein
MAIKRKTSEDRVSKSEAKVESSTCDRKGNGVFSSLITNDVKNTTGRVLSVYHCLIHDESPKINNAATVVVLVNYIRSKVLNLRQFKEFFSDTDSDSRHVLYCTDISWLGRGRLLKCA